jgi:hypothetical protein
MKAFAVILALLIPASAFAQSPYSGMQARPIKALSEQQIADLKAGRGMGLALPAELNGYPGPSHVLELSDKLALSADQKNQIQQLFNSMKAEAIPVGSKLIDQETALDQEFSNRSITADKLRAATTDIGATQAELRNIHLKYHLETVRILSRHQMHQYADLRGYNSSTPMKHAH